MGIGKDLTKSKVREVLNAAVDTIVGLLSGPESQKVIKVVISERSRIPKLREKQAELAAIGITALSEFLKRAKKSGAVDCPDPVITARILIGIIFTQVMMGEFLDLGSRYRIDATIKENILQFVFKGLGID